MFNLESKDAQAFLEGFQQLMITMSWTSAIDFDLFAVYQAKDGQEGLVYYNDLGDLNRFPFMKLSGDEGQGDQGGDNEESMVIASLDHMSKVWLCCWDYPQVQNGAAGRFSGSDLKIVIRDDKAGQFNVPLVGTAQGNVACIATIDCTSPISVKLLNTSRSTILAGLDAQQLSNFIRQG